MHTHTKPIARMAVAIGLLLAVLVPFCFLMPVHAQQLQVSAASCVLMEQQSGQVLYQKDADKRRPMASTTKIMTAYVAITHTADLSQMVTVDPRAVGIEGTSIYLRAQEQITMQDLLYAVLLSSANDAAAAIAYALCESVEAFADLMNDQAREWQLENTHFANPHGLDDPQHYTTAKELAIIARHALNNPTFATIAATKRHTQTQGTNRTFVNHNRLLRTYEGAVGVKTGFTKKSGRCLVSAAQRDGVGMIAVTLNASGDWQDHKQLLDYGFAHYTRMELYAPQSLSVTLPVVGGVHASVTLQNQEAFCATVPQGTVGAEVKIEAPRFFFAPVSKGQMLATAYVYVDGVCIGQLPLTATYEVPVLPKKHWWQRLLRPKSALYERTDQ